MKSSVSRNSTKCGSCLSKPVGPSTRRSFRIVMASIVMQMMLMSSKAHQLGSSSIVPCSTLALTMLLASTSMQGCYAADLPQQALFEDAKKSNEKAPKALRRLKKSTKSTKSDNNDSTVDVVDPAPEEENEDFEQVGDDIPRVERLGEISLIAMSEDGQRFADTNNVYEYDKSSRSWKSISPESFAGYDILGMSGDGETVLCVKYDESTGMLLIESRIFNNDNGTWITKGSRWIPYVPPEDIRHWNPEIRDLKFSNGVVALSRDGKRFVLRDDVGYRIFEYNSENRWVKIGNKIRVDGNRVLGISDDGSRIAFQGQGDAVYVHELVKDENSEATWKQLGGDLGAASYPSGNEGTGEFSMSSSGNRVVIGVADAYYDRYYDADAIIKEYNTETQEWEQVANRLPGGKHVKISAYGDIVAVGRTTDLGYYYGDHPCCNNYVKFYKLWRGTDGEAYWDEVATITSGPRRFFSSYMAATGSLNRMVVAASETYSVFDVTFSDDIGPCVDQEGASFPLINVDKEVGCDWLTKYGKDWVRRGKYCVESHDGGSVMKLCRKSCGICIP